MVVHFNRLKKCPANLRDGLQPLQYNSPGESGDFGQLEGTKSVGTEVGVSTQCHGEGAFIPDVDEVAEIEELVNLEQSPAEETSASEETSIITDDQSAATDHEILNEEIVTAGQTPITQESLSSRRYPSREHRLPHRYDDYVPH